MSEFNENYLRNVSQRDLVGNPPKNIHNVLNGLNLSAWLSEGLIKMVSALSRTTILSNTSKIQIRHRMKITVESTEKIVHLNGIPARVWEGQTESGIKVHCFINRVAIDVNETRTEEFEIELQQQKPPSEELKAIPLRLIL